MRVAADLGETVPDGACVRLRDRRRRFRRLRARQPAHHGSLEQGAGPGGGPSRLHLGRLHPHARGAHLPDRMELVRLEVRVRARATHGGASHLPRARQGPRRVEQHQRDDLPARQSARLRALGGGPGDGDVGLRSLPPVLPAHGVVSRGGARRRVPRAQRPADPRAWAGEEPVVRRVLRSRAASGVLAHRRRQRVSPGGLRAVRPERAPRAPAVGRSRVPAPGVEPSEPRRAHTRVRQQGLVRGNPSRRRRVRTRDEVPRGGFAQGK